MADNVEYLFMCIIAIWISSSVNVISCIGHFLVEYFFCWVIRFFSIFSPFSDTWFTNIFAHSIYCLYIIFTLSQNKSFEVDEVSLSTFLLIYCAFGIKPNFFYLIPDSNDSFIIFPINFIVLFTYRSVIHFKFCMNVKVKWKLVTQSCPTLFDTTNCSPPGSTEFSRQELWSGLPFPSSGDLPNPGIKPRSPALWADSLPTEPPVSTKSRQV